MPTTLTGNASTDPTSSPTASCPLDTETANAASVDNPFQTILNAISWIRAAMSLLAGNNVFSGNNTFNQPVNVATPTASAHAVTKNLLDIEIYNRQQNDSLEQTTRGIQDNNLQASINGMQPFTAKAWARLRCSTGGAVTIVEGIGISSASYNIAALTVNLVNTRVNTNYAVLLSSGSYLASFGCRPVYDALTVNSFGVYKYNSSGGAQNWGNLDDITVFVFAFV